MRADLRAAALLLLPCLANAFLVLPRAMHVAVAVVPPRAQIATSAASSNSFSSAAEYEASLEALHLVDLAHEWRRRE